MQQQSNILQSQMITLASLESLKSYQLKLADKDIPLCLCDSYRIHTERCGKSQSRIIMFLLEQRGYPKSWWTGGLVQGRFEIKESGLVQKKQVEVDRIRLHNQDK